MAACSSSHPLGVLQQRRDANETRRPGTGRVTTKRAFALTLPLPSVGLVGRSTGLALKAGERDARGLDDVEHFWRDSLEGGVRCAITRYVAHLMKASRTKSMVVVPSAKRAVAHSLYLLGGS